MRRILGQTQRLLASEVGLAALAYANSSSVIGMAVAVALDLALRTRCLLLMQPPAGHDGSFS